MSTIIFATAPANHFRNIIKQYEETQVSVTVVEALLRVVASTPHVAAYAAGKR